MATLTATLQVCDTGKGPHPIKQATTEDCATDGTFADLFDHSPGQATAASPMSTGSFSFCMPTADNNENTEPNSSLRRQPRTEISSLPRSKPVAQDSLGFVVQGPGQENGTATEHAKQEQHKQHTTPRRRRGGWGAPQAVPSQPLGSSRDAAAAAGFADSAKQHKQVVLPRQNTHIFLILPQHVFRWWLLMSSQSRQSVTCVFISQEHQGCAALVDQLALAVDQGNDAWQETAAALRQHADALDSVDCYDAHMEMGTLLASR